MSYQDTSVDYQIAWEETDDYQQFEAMETYYLEQVRLFDDIAFLLDNNQCKDAKDLLIELKTLQGFNDEK